jgi:hypothetical protein
MYLGSAASARNSLGPEAPQQIVVDKLAGQALTMFTIALLKPVEICNSMALGFGLFRLVDVVAARPPKPHSGAGFSLRTLMTTLVAGAAAGIFCAGIIRMLPAYFD